jgi:hypothetical protein
VFIPKFRRKALYGQLLDNLGELFRKLATQKGKQDRRRAFDAGSCAHDDFDPTEIRGFASDRIFQGQQCDPSGPRLRGTAAHAIL